jgi:hypothetical protein
MRVNVTHTAPGAVCANEGRRELFLSGPKTRPARHPAKIVSTLHPFWSRPTMSARAVAVRRAA